MEQDEKIIADVFEKVGLAKIVREQVNNELTNAVQSAMIELTEQIKKIRSEEYTIGFNDAAFARKAWKPSEEQIGALNYAYCELFKRGDIGHNILGPLQKLIDQLRGQM